MAARPPRLLCLWVGLDQAAPSAQVLAAMPVLDKLVYGGVIDGPLLLFAMFEPIIEALKGGEAF